MNRRTREVAPPIDPALDERLRNWARVYRDRPVQGYSLTGLICERLEREAGLIPPRPLTIEPDYADAAEVERAWRSSLLPMQQKAILRAAWVLNLAPWRTARVAGFPERRYGHELHRAACMIGNILRMRAASAAAAEDVKAGKRHEPTWAR